MKYLQKVVAQPFKAFKSWPWCVEPCPVAMRITCIRKEVILLGRPCLASIMHCFEITWWCWVEHIHTAIIHVPTDTSKIFQLQNLSIQHSITAFRNYQSSCNSKTIVLPALLYCNEISSPTFDSRTKSTQENSWMWEKWNNWRIKVQYITTNFTVHIKIIHS
jgi:hypothetical protein